MTRITLENGYSSHSMPNIVTDALIIGTGPAGGALASFLASHGKSTATQFPFYVGCSSVEYYVWCKPGIRGIVVSAGSTTADTPRAHITNMAAMGKSVSPSAAKKLINRGYDQSVCAIFVSTRNVTVLPPITRT